MKILRTWTVVEWTSQQVFEYVQLIKFDLIGTEFICDFLPHTADVGDCDSGHTLEDDVEWPADISIADYRITPDELVEFSGVDAMDASPTLYNSPSEYSMDYTDFLADISQDQLVVARQWKIQRPNLGLSWYYTQDITIDFTDFAGLVTVTTSTNRAVPGVDINGATSTDEKGNATYLDDDILQLSLLDENMNGSNILDAVLLNLYNQDEIFLNGSEILAADIDNNGEVNLSLIHI